MVQSEVRFRFLDSQRLDARRQRRRLHTQQDGSTVRSENLSLGESQGLYDVLLLLPSPILSSCHLRCGER